MSLYTLVENARAAMQKFVDVMTGDVTADIDLTSIGGSGVVPSLPKALSMGSALVFTGGNLAEVAVASAATLDLTGVTSPKVRVTGSVNITSIIGNAHSMYFLRFVDGGLTIENDSAHLMLPDNGDIAVEAGDLMWISTTASGATVRCRDFQSFAARADGTSRRGKVINAGASPVQLKRGINIVKNLTAGVLVCNLPSTASSKNGDFVIVKDGNASAAVHEYRITPSTGTIEGDPYVIISVNKGWRTLWFSEEDNSWFQVP